MRFEGRCAIRGAFTLHKKPVGQKTVLVGIGIQGAAEPLDKGHCARLAADPQRPAPPSLGGRHLFFHN